MIPPGLGEFAVIVKVSYFLIIKSISDCCTGFPILGFSGGFHTQNNSVNIVIYFSVLYSVHTVIDIHVWLSIEILNALFSPSLNIKGKFYNLYVLYCT